MSIMVRYWSARRAELRMTDLDAELLHLLLPAARRLLARLHARLQQMQGQSHQFQLTPATRTIETRRQASAFLQQQRQRPAG